MPTPESFHPHWTSTSPCTSLPTVLLPSSATSMYTLVTSPPWHREDLQTGAGSVITFSTLSKTFMNHCSRQVDAARSQLAKKSPQGQRGVDIEEMCSRVDHQHPAPHNIAPLLVPSQSPERLGSLAANTVTHLPLQTSAPCWNPVQHSNGPAGGGGGSSTTTKQISSDATDDCDSQRRSTPSSGIGATCWTPSRSGPHACKISPPLPPSWHSAHNAHQRTRVPHNIARHLVSWGKPYYNRIMGKFEIATGVLHMALLAPHMRPL